VVVLTGLIIRHRPRESKGGGQSRRPNGQLVPFGRFEGFAVTLDGGFEFLGKVPIEARRRGVLLSDFMSLRIFHLTNGTV